MQRSLLSIVVLLASVLGPTAAFGETVESVQKKIAEQIGRYKTIRLKSRQKMNMDMPQMKMQQTSESTLEAVKKGDGCVSRQETRDKTVQKLADQPEQKLEGTTLIIFDGKALYTLMDRADQKMATKMTPDSDKPKLCPFDMAAAFEVQRKDYDSKLLADEDVEGKSCYVIELKAKQPQPLASRMVVWYQKDTGVAVKMQSFDESGKEVMSSVVTDIKTDGEISADRFVFKAPAGVEVRDLDKELAPQTAPAAGTEQPKEKAAAEKEASVEEKPAEPAKKAEQPKPSKSDPVKGVLKGLLRK